ncbi:hypothetical protein AAGW05_13335 [Arthrobacter sp. LAPM80]|uniref:hypothetical protein n=1 Tax=Arthrobacter sp. LAPM80 TaxID=3141788 RepID=UPI00398B54E3
MATNAPGWPTAMVFMSMAIFGSLLMIGLQIAAHTGYGVPLLAVSVGVWAVFTSLTWTFMPRTTKAGFSRCFLRSLFSYMALYVIAVLGGTLAFADGNIAYYVSSALVLAVTGIASAFRELRA